MIKKLYINNFTLNFGPQHPAAHGVLRLVTFLKGESIKYVDPHIGLLHRGTEKLVEQKNFLQILPYFDRLDYVSTMNQEHTFSLCIEYLLNIKISNKASLLRIIFLELTRILNHLMAITTHALDLGAISPFLWAFEEREKIMQFYEKISGARLHAAYIQPGGLNFDVYKTFFLELEIFLINFKQTIDKIEQTLNSNII